MTRSRTTQVISAFLGAMAVVLLGDLAFPRAQAAIGAEVFAAVKAVVGVAAGLIGYEIALRLRRRNSR